MKKDQSLINIYVPNNGASEYIKQKLSELKGEIDTLTNIVEDVSIPFSMMDAKTR